MNKNLADKFFANQTSPGETEAVLEWFLTDDGKNYLERRLDVDAGLMDRKELKDLVPELDSDKLYSSIQAEMGKKTSLFSLHRADWIGTVVKVAAAVLVIATASFFSLTYEKHIEETRLAGHQPIVFHTQDEQNRNIVLIDGTNISLNNNSQITVSPDYLTGNREVTLIGEAYFDVAHNPDKPFIIHANQSTVEVLGTAFNVRSQPGQDNVQVAVVDGRVVFQNKLRSEKDTNQLAVTLSKGQYGYMDLSKRTILVDDLAVENYLAWREGYLAFEGLTLSQVCIQLDRIYDIACSFENNAISELKITANFTNESTEKTLDVIALSLGVEYETEENGQTHWYTSQ